MFLFLIKYGNFFKKKKKIPLSYINREPMNVLVNWDPIKRRCFVVCIIIIQLKWDIYRYMPILYHIRDMFKSIVIFGKLLYWIFVTELSLSFSLMLTWSIKDIQGPIWCALFPTKKISRIPHQYQASLP